MSDNYQPKLRDRLIARHRPETVSPQILHVPPAGVLPPDVMARIHVLATSARAGDVVARDHLFFALQPRLHRKGYILRPWPNTQLHTGIWDRDDVQQECWLIFAELLAAWDGEKPFVPYLFARFAWRLRDRILRGIGRKLPPIGEVRVAEDLLGEVLAACDSDQPESAMLANRLLAHLLERTMAAPGTSLDAHAVLSVLRSPAFGVLRGGISLPDDDHPFTQIEVA